MQTEIVSTSKKFKKMPYKKKISHSPYSLGSLPFAEADVESEEQLYVRTIKGKGINDVIFQHFTNYASWIHLLMRKRSLKFIVQKPVLSTDYFETGNYDDKEIQQLKYIDILEFLSAGYICQVTIAGLQILYDVAQNWNFETNNMHEGEDHSILYKHREDDCTLNTHIAITFYFNNHPITLMITETYELWNCYADRKMNMGLYIVE